MFGRYPFGRRPFGRVAPYSSGAQVHNVSVSTTQAISVSRRPTIGRPIAVSQALAASLKKVVSRAIAVSQASAVLLAKGPVELLAFSLSASTAAFRSARKYFAIALASSLSSSVFRYLPVPRNKSISVSVSQSAVMVRSIGKIVTQVYWYFGGAFGTGPFGRPASGSGAYAPGRVQLGSAVSRVSGVPKINQFSLGHAAVMQKSTAKLFAMAMLQVASLVRPVIKLMQLTVAPLASFVNRALSRVFAITQAALVSLVKMVIKPPFAMTLALVATLRRLVAKLFTMWVGVAATLINGKAGNLVLAIPQASVLTLQRSTAKLVTLALAFVVTLRRATSRRIAIAQPTQASVIKSVGHAVATIVLGIAATLSQYRSFIRAFSAQVGALVSMKRSTAKLVLVAQSASETVRVSTARLINVGQAIQTISKRSVSKIIGLTQQVFTSIGSVKAFSVLINLVQSSSVMFASLQGFVLGFVQGTQVRLTKGSRRILAVGLPVLATLRPNLFRRLFLRVKLASSVSLLRRIGKVVGVGLAHLIEYVLRRLRDPGTTEPAVVRSGNNVFLVTLQGHDGTGVKTLRFGSEGIMTRPTDILSNEYFEPRIMDPGNFERHMAVRGVQDGSVGAGDVQLASGSPGRGYPTLDYLLDWALDGYTIMIESLVTSRQSTDDAKLLFKGTMEQLVTDDAYNLVSIKMHDRLSDLDQQLLTNSYAGTTISGGDGTADGNTDLKGVKKQWVLGPRRNVTPQISNPFDLVLDASDGAVHSMVLRDGGDPLINDGDVANLAALLAWTQVPGHYKTCNALGKVRPGNSPAFGWTIDVVEGATAADRTAAQLVLRILDRFNIDIGEIDTATFTALDAANDAECQILIKDDETALSAIRRLLSSIDADIVPDRAGIYQVLAFESDEVDPSEVIDLGEDTVIGDELTRIAPSNESRGLPVYRVTMRYDENPTPMNLTQIDGAVSEDDKTYLQAQWRSCEPSEDLTVRDRHKNAVEVTFDTCLVYEAATKAQADRHLARFKVRRDAYSLPAMLDYADAADLTKVVRLTATRFSLNAGKQFRVIGRINDFENKLVTPIIWGPLDA